MLSRLDLLGFKSFADRTRFDFHPGVTAVVGPNGSGKSNVVDAVKWIMGEQSAKSLRGGEMADVIFNGSATRKSFGMAEVTMTFDNRKRQLQFDGDEVQITRRVYRDGQGEYLINGAASRLKDIKEMFLGSGAGQGAYSIIEQGRVDALLVASTKDRRAIFEEAAGISRFKAKKLEALRKLEATEVNLNRVKDILQELEKSLKTLQNQAAKAKKYQEFVERLKALRIGLGLREYAETAETIAYQNDVLAKLQAEVSGANAKIAGLEAQSTTLDETLTGVDTALRASEKKLGESRQRIAQQEAAAKAQREQAANLETDLLRIGRERGDGLAKLTAILQQQHHADAEASSAATAADEEATKAEATAAALAVVVATINEVTRQVAQSRERQFALVGQAAKLKSTAEMTASQVERLRKELARKQAEQGKASAEAAAIESVLADLSNSNAELQGRLDEAKTSLATMQEQQQSARKRAESLQPKLDELRDRRGDVRGRLDVLEQLERNHEGLGSGVRQVLDAKDDNVLGVVADLLSVPREIAPLIDAVLGDVAQRVVVRDLAAAMTMELSGRVGFIPLTKTTSPLQEPRFAAITSPYPELVSQLLGSVKIVDVLNVGQASSLSRNTQDADSMQDRLEACPTTFVTATGEILEPNGHVIRGPLAGGAGLLSRKSELRELRDTLTQLDADAAGLDSQQKLARTQADELDAPIGGRTAEIAALAAKAGDVRDALTAQREKQTRLADLVDLASNEAKILDAELTKANAALTTMTAEADAADKQAAEVQTNLAAAEDQLKHAQSTREVRQHEHTLSQVAASRAKQTATAAAAKVTALKQELLDRQQQAITLEKSELATQQRLTQCQLAALAASMLAADAYAAKDRYTHEVAVKDAERQQLRIERDAVQDELKQIRESWQQRRDQAHLHELTVRDLVHRHATINDRLKDDYGIDLETLENKDQFAMAESDDDVQNEIDDLKKKIAKLGSVNLEALEQLAGEEQRERTLKAEFTDLTNAQSSLLDIIETINTDSRRLFTETLATVKVHFQELFRKLFGGGMADIILEDPTDVLESGIEITARPPGKELRSISLLSGGEKTMTAVALLLAMFRSKPSPFCLLDEVDAALDEANTARLAAVIREFTDQSQFIIITHKKRTMAMADVLYGITMQESGISKQVATRIEDWPDEEPLAA